MRALRTTVVPTVVPTVLAFAALTGCGSQRVPLGEPTGPAATATTTTAVTSPAARGDVGPHEAENNGWKQRRPLSADDQRVAQGAAARIRPELERLRQAGEFSPESVRLALVHLGFAPDAVQVRAFSLSPLSTASAAPPGTVYGVRVGGRGCVFGAVSPDEASADLDGPTAEWGCIPPGPTH